MIPDPGGKTESRENDPDELTRLLEMELLQKRAAWKRASARHSNIRTVSLLVLFVMIVGALFAFFLMFSTVSERRANQPANSVPTSSP